MSSLLRVVGYLSVAAVAFSVFVMIRSLGSEYRLRSRDLVVAAGFSTAFLALYAWLLDVATSGWTWALLVAGLVIGFAAGRITALRVVGEDVYARRSLWLVGPWVLGFAYAQLAVLGALPGGSDTGLRAMFLATGVTVGVSVSMGVRRAQVLEAAASHPSTDETPGVENCPHCSKPIPPAAQFCGDCGWRVVVGDGPHDASEDEDAGAPLWDPRLVPEGGMQAWAAPNPAAEVAAELAAATHVLVLERRGAWAHVSAETGWTGWVDDRRLVDPDLLDHTAAPGGG